MTPTLFDEAEADATAVKFPPPAATAVAPARSKPTAGPVAPARPPSAKDANLVARFRDAAERLDSEIAGKRRDRLTNTPKRQKEAASAAIDADHLHRVRRALVKLADAREAGTLPPQLAGIRSKAELLPMLRTRVDCSGGYYCVRDTGEFPDQSATAVALRAFLESATDATERLIDAERAKALKLADMIRDVRFRPIPGFFPTPPAVAAEVRRRAGLHKPFARVLEPSAGIGDLAEAMWVWDDGSPTHAVVHVCEIQPVLLDILRAKRHEVVGTDFLALAPPAEPYDRVVMNPPFENGQDIDHVRHAFGFLKPGGRLVSVMSTGPFYRQDRKATEFRAWFEAAGGEKHELPAGSFKDGFRSTGTATVLVVIDRGEVAP